MIVVDASVVVTALGDDGEHGAIARHRLAHEDLLAPHLIDVEVLSAWRRLMRTRHMSEARANQAIRDLADMRIERSAHTDLAGRAWELKDNLSSYDAVYVSLAEVAECTLVTADKRLAVAPGTRCEIEVLTDGS